MTRKPTQDDEFGRLGIGIDSLGADTWRNSTKRRRRLWLSPITRNAVLEANAKVSERCQISHPTLPKPLNQFGWRFKYIAMSTQGVDVQNLVQIDTAVINLRMREKNAYFLPVDFFVNIPVSIYPSTFIHLSIPFFLGASGHILRRFRCIMAQMMFCNHWYLLGVSIHNILTFRGISPKPPFSGRE